MDASSLKRRRRRMTNRHFATPIRWMSITTAALLLVLVAVWDDESNPTFFASSQSTPQAPQLITPGTRSPTAAPVVVAPTTNRPVIAPTSRPVTDAPTALPSIVTTPDPTPTPTTKPTISESEVPSTKPSARVTEQPSDAPSVSPKPTSITASPTVSSQPTMAPTLAPISRAPIRQPVRDRTTSAPIVDEESPSQAPTITQQTTTVSIDVILSPMQDKLFGQSFSDFEAVTATFLMDQLTLTLLSNDNVGSGGEATTTVLDVQTDILSQKIENGNNNRQYSRILRRRLQSDGNRLRIRCNAQVVYQLAAEEDDDVPGWIQQSFGSEQDRALYISELQSAANSNAFDSVRNVKVVVAGTEPISDDEPIDQNSDNSSGFFSNENLWYIIGAVGGTLSLVVIISMLYLIHRKKQNMDGANGKQNMTALTNIKNQLSYDSDTSQTNKLQYTAEIDVDLQNDDVSTLGDPTYYGGAPDQPTVASGQLPDAANYFAATAFNNGSGTVHAQRQRFLSDETDEDNLLVFSESNLSKQNDDIVTHTVIDDNGFTSQRNNDKPVRDGGYGSKFAVEVPPGKLGMIIDTPDNGPPIVHTIKPESILVATVQAGDYLLSVDDENVSHMTAVQVSKLISIKSDQQRTLLFLRKNANRNRINSSSSDYMVEKNGTC